MAFIHVNRLPVLALAILLYLAMLPGVCPSTLGGKGVIADFGRWLAGEGLSDGPLVRVHGSLVQLQETADGTRSDVGALDVKVSALADRVTVVHADLLAASVTIKGVQAAQAEQRRVDAQRQKAADNEQEVLKSNSWSPFELTVNYASIASVVWTAATGVAGLATSTLTIVAVQIASFMGRHALTQAYAQWCTPTTLMCLLARVCYYFYSRRKSISNGVAHYRRTAGGLLQIVADAASGDVAVRNSDIDDDATDATPAELDAFIQRLKAKRLIAARLEAERLQAERLEADTHQPVAQAHLPVATAPPAPRRSRSRVSHK